MTIHELLSTVKIMFNIAEMIIDADNWKKQA